MKFIYSPSTTESEHPESSESPVKKKAKPHKRRIEESSDEEAESEETSVSSSTTKTPRKSPKGKATNGHHEECSPVASTSSFEKEECKSSEDKAPPKRVTGKA